MSVESLKSELCVRIKELEMRLFTEDFIIHIWVWVGIEYIWVFGIRRFVTNDVSPTQQVEV